MTSERQLVRALRRASDRRLLTRLTGLTARERTELGPVVRGWESWDMPRGISEARRLLAILAVAEGVRQAMSGLSEDRLRLRHPPADMVPLLAARSPRWLDEFAARAAALGDSLAWAVVESLTTSGLVPEQDHPEQLLGAIGRFERWPARRGATLLELVPSDLLGDRLLRMLSTELAGRRLSEHDALEAGPSYDHLGPRRPDRTWRESIRSLTTTGALDRDRTLDVVLTSLGRDWAAADMPWFVALHDALEPTVEEVLARQEAYVSLLLVPHGPSVRMAQSQLRRAAGEASLDVGAVLDATPAVLGRPDKAVPMAQLRLVEDLGARGALPDPGAAIEVGLQHPHVDVRERSARLLGRSPADARPRRLDDLTVTPHRPRPVAAEVRPVESADEVAELLLQLVEEIDAIDLERAIDGMLRLDHRDTSLTSALRRRIVGRQLDREDPRGAVVVLTCAWLGLDEPDGGRAAIDLGRAWGQEGPSPATTLVGAVSRRLSGVVRLLRSRRPISLALPTLDDGSLDPEVLQRRLREVEDWSQVSRLEVGAALLRVEPARRPDIELPSWVAPRAVAPSGPGDHPDWERVISSVSGGRGFPPVGYPVFRGRPSLDLGDLAGLGPRPNPELTIDVERRYGSHEPRFDTTLALAAVMLPHDPDSLAANSHAYLRRDLERARACATPVVAAIARSDGTPGAPSWSALALAAAAQDPLGRTAAVDTLVDLAERGILDGVGLGRQAALHLLDDVVVGGRVAAGLRDAAVASEAAALPVLAALQEVLPAVVDRHDAGRFVTLAADLRERTGRPIRLPDALADLGAGSSRSGLARAARRLLATT